MSNDPDTEAPAGASPSSNYLRWFAILVVVLGAIAALAGWRIHRIRHAVDTARDSARVQIAHLQELIDEAERAALIGADPAALRAEVALSEQRLATGVFAIARTEELEVMLQLGIARCATGDFNSARSRFMEVEQAAFEHEETRRGFVEAEIMRTTLPDRCLADRARTELARARFSAGDAIGALTDAHVALELGANDPACASTARALSLAGEALIALDDDSGAEAYLREALDSKSNGRRLSPFECSATYAHLASVRRDRDEIVGLRRKALAAARTGGADDDPRVAWFMYELAGALDDSGPRARDESEDLFARSLEARRATACGDLDTLATHLNNYGLLMKHKAKLRQAEALFIEALEMCQRLRPAGDRGTATIMNNIGTTRQSLGDARGAADMLTASLTMRRRLFPDGNSDVAQTLQNLAWVRQTQGDHEASVRHGKEALKILRRDTHGDDFDLAIAIDNLASALLDAKKYAEAEPLAREALAMERRLVSGDDPDVAQTLDTLGLIQLKRKRLSESAQNLTAALAMRRALFSDRSSSIAETLKHMAWLHEELSQFDEAEAEYHEAIQIQRKSGAEHSELFSLEEQLADCVRQHDPRAALTRYRELVVGALHTWPASAHDVGVAAQGLARSAYESEVYADAEEALLAAAGAAMLTESVAIEDRIRTVDAISQFYMRWDLADTLGNRSGDVEAWNEKLALLEQR